MKQKRIFAEGRRYQFRIRRRRIFMKLFLFDGGDAKNKTPQNTQISAGARTLQILFPLQLPGVPLSFYFTASSSVSIEYDSKRR